MLMPEAVVDMEVDSAVDMEVDSAADMEGAGMEVVDSAADMEEAGMEEAGMEEAVHGGAAEDGPAITGEHIPAITGEPIMAVAGMAHIETGITTMLIPAIVFTSASLTIIGRSTITGLIITILRTIRGRGSRCLQRRRRMSNKGVLRRCSL